LTNANGAGMWRKREQVIPSRPALRRLGLTALRGAVMEKQRCERPDVPHSPEGLIASNEHRGGDLTAQLYAILGPRIAHRPHDRLCTNERVVPHGAHGARDAARQQCVERSAAKDICRRCEDSRRPHNARTQIGWEWLLTRSTAASHNAQVLLFLRDVVP
jgi:hypothetical protein